MKMSLVDQNSPIEKSIEEIILQENKSWPSSESEKKYAKNLHDLTPSDIKLGEFLQEKGILDFKRLQDKGLHITAKQFVGTVNFSKFKLKIIPKIYNKEKKDIWKNLATCIYFIEGYSLAKIVEFEKNEFIDNDESVLQEFIIWALVFQCKELIKKGLLKSYISNEENLSFLRGKIILKNQFVNDAQKNVKFFCEYDELEYDNIDNRIIFHILLKSKRLAISLELKRNIFLLIEQFSGMVQNVQISIRDIDRVMRSYNRQNMHYEDTHKLCKLILENTGISDFDGGKTPFAVPFFMDMNKIFEKFVTKLFDDNYPNQVDSQHRQMAWKVTKNPSRFIIPDIILRNKKEKTVRIIDVKYKPKLEPSDLYQIGFYIHEFRDDDKKPTDNSAFAILPDYDDADKTDKNFISVEKEIQIFQRHISLDNFIDLIRAKKIKEFRNELEKILDPGLDTIKNL